MPVKVKAHNRHRPRKPQGPKSVHVVAHSRPPTRGAPKKAAPAAPKQRGVYIPRRQPGDPKKPVKYATKQRKKARRAIRRMDPLDRWLARNL